MLVLAGSDSLLASHLLPLLRDTDPVCAFDSSMGDIGDAQFMERLLDEMKPDTVINCFEIGDIERCERERESAYAVNALGAGRLGAICRDRGIHLIQVSTSYVFDGESEAPRAEEDPTGPVQAYGDSKLLGEKLVRESGCSFLIMRFPDLYGRGGSYLGELLRAMGRGETLTVLEGHRVSPTRAGDAAGALLAVMKMGYRGILHYSAGGSVTVRGFLEEAAERLGRLLGTPLFPDIREVPYDEFLSAADFPRTNLLHCSKYADLTGKPPGDWKDALEAHLTACLADFR